MLEIFDSKLLKKVTCKKEELLKFLHNEYKSDMDSINSVMDGIINNKQNLISKISSHLIKNSGKRIRPLLTIMSAKLFGYEGDRHIPLATAVEFIHAATLLHDDVIDESMVRRFIPSANSIWGNKASILVGDYLFSSSFKLMVSSNSIKALSILSEASSIIASGEVSQLSVLKSKNILSKQEYMDIISAKTAELFYASTKVGAIISGQNDDVSELLGVFGRNFGIIYQITDDLLDYLSESETIGKNIGDDFYEGKFTLPVIILFEKATKEVKNFIKKVFLSESEKSKENLEKIIKLLKEYDIKKEVNIIIYEILKEAISIINELNINNNHSQNLIKLINFAYNRVS